MIEGGARVLVIEDHPLSRELVVAVLESLDCDVMAADSAEAGLALADATPPALILLDLRLPGLSGFEALRLIRDRPALRAVPVIAVTAQAMHGDEASVRRAGFDGYLSKPIDTHRLRDLVRDHLHSHRSS